MVSVKAIYPQQHPLRESHRQQTRSKVGFGLFNRYKNGSATSTMSPSSEHERLKTTWSPSNVTGVDQGVDTDVDMLVATPASTSSNVSSTARAMNSVYGSSVHANGGMMPDGVANGVDAKPQHADQTLPPPVDNNFVRNNNMEKAANRRLFNSILCCIRSARPDRLMLRGSSPMRDASLMSPGDDAAAGPLRGGNKSENGFAGGSNNNMSGIRYMNGVGAVAKHHNRLQNGYYRGPLSVNGSSNTNNNSNIPLLPPARNGDEHRKLLVIDLDETLVHSSFKPVPAADFIVPVEIDGVTHQVYVQKRPHVDEFLQKMGELYECVLFTASLAKYADPVADLLDKHGVFRARLFRESCVLYRGNYVKDLSRLGRDLEKIIIVDNSPGSYSFHPEHAIPVLSWFDDMTDRELLDLVPFLSIVSAEEAHVAQTLKCINVLTGTDANGSQYVQSTVTKSMAAGDEEHGVMVRTTQERETTVQPSSSNARNNNNRSMMNNNSTSGENSVICSVQQSSCTTTSPTMPMKLNGFAQPLRAKDMMSLLMSTLQQSSSVNGNLKVPKQIKPLNESSTTMPSVQNGGTVCNVKHISAQYHPSSLQQRSSVLMPNNNTNDAVAHRARTSSATRPSRLSDQLSTAKQSLIAVAHSSNTSNNNAESVSSCSPQQQAACISEMPNSPTSPSYSTELLFSPTPVDAAKEHSSDHLISAADDDINNPSSDVYKLGQSIRNEAVTNLVVGDDRDKTSSFQPRGFAKHSTITTTTTSMLPPPTVKATGFFHSPSNNNNAALLPTTKKAGEPGIDEYASDRAAVDGMINNLSDKSSSYGMQQQQLKPMQFSTNSLRRRGELYNSSKEKAEVAPTSTTGADGKPSLRSSSAVRTAVKPTSTSSSSSSTTRSGGEEVIPFIDSNPSTPTHDKTALLSAQSNNRSRSTQQQQVAVANGVASQAKAKLLAASSLKQPLAPQPVLSSHKSASKHALSYRKSGNYDNIRRNDGGGSDAANNGTISSTSTLPPTPAVLTNGNSNNSGIKAASHFLRSSQNNNHHHAAAVPNGYGRQRSGLSTSTSQQPTPADKNSGSLLRQPTKLTNGLLHSPFNKASSTGMQNGTVNGRAENNNFPHRTIVSLGPVSR